MNAREALEIINSAFWPGTFTECWTPDTCRETVEDGEPHGGCPACVMIAALAPVPSGAVETPTMEAALREIMVAARDLTTWRSDDALLVHIAQIAARALLAGEVETPPVFQQGAVGHFVTDFTPDCGVETPEAAVEATTTAMRVERHRHDRYALSPTPGPYTIECKCGQAFVITPGSLTLYEQWCHHVEARVLSAVRAQGWTPPGGTE